VLNKPNREIPIMESIKSEILTLKPDAEIEIKEMCVSGFNTFVFNFRPAVILTFPFTCEGFSRWYYLFKFFLGVKIISLRAEGVVDFSNEYSIQWAVGFDDYGRSLVDYEVFWGGKLAYAVGEQLLKQKKLSSIERIKVVGYPRLESYFEKDSQERHRLPLRIKKRLSHYEKKNVILFITGFHLANYSRQNLIDAKDLDAEKNMEDLLEGVEISKRFRSEWVEAIIAVALENSDMLIVVKKHPVEKNQDYANFKGVENILFVYEDIQVDEIVPCVGILFHYGSTALVDAYLSHIPSVYVYSNDNKQWYTDLGWPSSGKVDVYGVLQAVKDYRSGNFVFNMNDDIKRILNDVFDIKAGQAYCPSKRIAQLLLDSSSSQKIKLTDPYLWKAIAAIFIAPIFNRIARIFKKTFASAQHN